jgi:eukaryotic-like serine/threonine-protein kinase
MTLRLKAEKAYQHFLEQEGGEDSQGFDAFVEGSPELRDELLALHDERKLISQILAGLGKESSPSRDESEESDLGLHPGKILGDFRLIQELGKGGMGAVWEAEQISLKRLVALKMLLPQYVASRKFVQRFQREAEAGGRLTHNGIVQTHAVGEADNIHWISQELVPGGKTMSDWLEQVRKFKDLPAGHFRGMAGLFAQVADALAFAHEEGVIHRDIKPGNILLEGGERPKVTDFGLAQVQDDLGLSKTGELLGTPFYMSPEQAMTRRMGIDHRTDIFSLGATLYEALTLRRPFEGDTSHQVFRKIVTEDPPDPRRIRSHVPRDLVVICQACLEKNPERRYASMVDLAADLRRFLADEPIHAKPPSPIARVNKWVRRHPVMALATLALAVVSVMWWREGQLRRQVVKVAEQKSRVLGFVDDALGEAAYAAVDFQTFLDSMMIRLNLEGMEVGDRAMAQSAIGNAYLGISLNKKALQLLDETEKIMTAEFGEAASETLLAKSRLANAVARSGRAADAVAIHREVLQTRVETLPEEDLSIYQSMNDLAGVLLLLGGDDAIDEAESLLWETLAARKKKLPEGDLAIMTTASNLATILARTKRAEGALDLLSMARARYSEIFGVRHPRVLGILCNEAMTLVQLGRFEEAENILLQVLKDSSSFPKTHHVRIQCLFSNTQYWMIRGQQAESPDLRLEMFKKSTDHIQEILEVADPDSRAFQGAQGLLGFVEGLKERG